MPSPLSKTKSATRRTSRSERPAEGSAAPSSRFARAGARMPELAAALRRLSALGLVTGARSRKVSVRIDPGVLEAASKELGLTHPSDVVNASLALAAAPDRFKAWLRGTQDTLPDDFESAV